MPLGDLDPQEQKEAYRHVEEMSQRFLRLILATLALGLVFARPSWVDYMTNASPPSPGLRATREGGAFIGQLSPTIVLNNGNILKWLVVLSLVSLVIAILLAGLVVFLIEPSEEFQSGYETALAYLMLRRKSKQLLRRAYAAAFSGILFLILAGVGFWTFYITGGLSILLYDFVVVVVGSAIMILFVYRYSSALSMENLENVESAEEMAELCVYLFGALIAIFFYRYVWYNALNGLLVWAVVTGLV